MTSVRHASGCLWTLVLISYWKNANYTPCSHTRTVVRECCKVDDASQWENWKFDPLPRRNPLTNRHRKLHTWLSWISTDMQNLVTIPQGVSFPRMREIAHQNVYSASLFLGSSNGLQPRPLNRFSGVIRQTTRFRARGCLLGVRNKNLTFTTVIPEKPPFWGPILTGLRKFSTENRFTMGVLPCKLPLIVVVAP